MDRKKITDQVLSALVILVYLWMMLPEHRRQFLQLRALSGAREACRRAAQVTGRSSMRAELAIGTRRYELPLALSTLAEWCSRSYERVRG